MTTSDIVEKLSDTAFQAEVAASLKLSRSQRLKRIARSGDGTPQRITVSVTRFSRNPHVVAERLSRANGFCEHCELPAPFLRIIDQTPFLEVHHKRPLSKGGLDTVENTEALCPNCHSKKHDRLRMDREVE